MKMGEFLLRSEPARQVFVAMRSFSNLANFLFLIVHMTSTLFGYEKKFPLRKSF